jgi:hypothetical protein
MSRGATVGAEEEESGGRLKMMEVARPVTCLAGPYMKHLINI